MIPVKVPNVGEVIAKTTHYELRIGHQTLGLRDGGYPPIVYQVVDHNGVVNAEGPQLPAAIRAMHAFQEFYAGVLADPTGDLVPGQPPIADPFSGPGGRE